MISSSKFSPEDIPVFLRADDLLTVRFCFFFIFDAGKGVGKAIALSGNVVDEYVPAGPSASIQDVTAVDLCNFFAIFRVFKSFSRNRREN